MVSVSIMFFILFLSFGTERVHIFISCSITSSGLLSAASEVKPTMSLKNIVTCSNDSAVTGSPRFNCSATLLARRNNQSLEVKENRFMIYGRYIQKSGIQKRTEELTRFQQATRRVKISEAYLWSEGKLH